jgi:hypothetical protein
VRLGSVTLLALSVAGSACTEAQSAPDAHVGEDGGLPDTGIVLDASGGELDARPSVDAGPAGVVTVIVEARSGAPIADVEIVFQSAEGDVLAYVLTEAEGRAMSAVPVGAMVTAVRVAGGMLETRVGVVPPETIYFRRFDSEPEPSIRTEPLVSFPGTLPGASVYYASAGCGPELSARAEAVRLALWSSCVGTNDSFAVVAEANEDEMTPPIAQSIAPSNLVAGSTQEIRLPPWSTAFFDTEVRVTNVPEGAGVLRAAYFTVNGQRFSFRGNDRFEPALNAMPVVFAVRFPDSPAVGAYELMYGVTDTNLVARSTRWDSFALPPPVLMIDPRADLLGTVTEVSVSIENVARPAVTWTTADGVTEVSDAVEISAFWQRSNRQYEWRVKLPPDATSFRFPALPRALVGYEPSGTSLHLVYGDSSFLSWDDVRRGREIRDLPGPGYFRETSAGSF